VITGGASGIGLALATKCAGYGMSVLIADNNSANLSAAKSSIKGKVETVEVDVSKISDFEKLKSKVEKDLGGKKSQIFDPGPRARAQDIKFIGKISLLALNAGIGPKGSWEDRSWMLICSV
jgi:NAD(P)-dependent dehydrogenase (short-subunit alcohol dehydrogenase family)